VIVVLFGFRSDEAELQGNGK